MRTMSSSVSVTALELLRGFPSISVLHTVTRNFSKTILGLVLRLVGLILISVLLCLTLIFDFFLVQPLLDCDFHKT